MVPIVLLIALVGLAIVAGMATPGLSFMTQPNLANRSAFLAAIRMSEGTAVYADPYHCVYGGGSFSDDSDHPSVTGEWTGVQTQWGFTTAAGAYQIIKPTWVGLGGRAHYGDFSQPSQDAAAIDLITQAGAIADVDAGRVDVAIGKLGHIWASFPSSTAGQPTAQLGALVTSYTSNGGSVA